MTTSEMDRAISNPTSRTEARMTVVRSVNDLQVDGLVAACFA